MTLASIQGTIKDTVKDHLGDPIAEGINQALGWAFGDDGLVTLAWHLLLAAAPGLMGLAIILVALRYVTAADNEVKAARAKKQAVRVVIGIAMYAGYLIFKGVVLELGSFMSQGFGGG